MRKKLLGKTGLEVSILGFGGIPISRIPREQAVEVAKHALDRGINYFDTARAYGGSESRMGEALAGRRSEFYISTKGNRRSADETRRDLETGLSNLGMDYVDIYFIHDVSRERDRDRVLAPDGALAAIQRAKSEGLVRHAAISGHRSEIMTDLIKTAEFDVAMIPVNIADQDFLADVVPLARELDVGLVVMKPFAGGALDDADICLRYALDQDVTTVIPGMRSVAEVDENLGIAESFQSLTEAERSRLDEAAKALGKHFCRQCGYCQPCPAGVNIPHIFLLDRYYQRYWLKDVASAEYAKMEVNATACKECGECEERCPYFLPIRQMLKEADARLQA